MLHTVTTNTASSTSTSTEVSKKTNPWYK